MKRILYLLIIAIVIINIPLSYIVTAQGLENQVEQIITELYDEIDNNEYHLAKTEVCIEKVLLAFTDRVNGLKRSINNKYDDINNGYAEPEDGNRVIEKLDNQLKYINVFLSVLEKYKDKGIGINDIQNIKEVLYNGYPDGALYNRVPKGEISKDEILNMNVLELYLNDNANDHLYCYAVKYNRLLYKEKLNNLLNLVQSKRNIGITQSEFDEFYKDFNERVELSVQYSSAVTFEYNDYHRYNYQYISSPATESPIEIAFGMEYSIYDFLYQLGKEKNISSNNNGNKPIPPPLMPDKPGSEDIPDKLGGGDVPDTPEPPQPPIEDDFDTDILDLLIGGLLPGLGSFASVFLLSNFGGLSGGGGSNTGVGQSKRNNTTDTNSKDKEKGKDNKSAWEKVGNTVDKGSKYYGGLEGNKLIENAGNKYAKTTSGIDDIYDTRVQYNKSYQNLLKSQNKYKSAIKDLKGLSKCTKVGKGGQVLITDKDMYKKLCNNFVDSSNGLRDSKGTFNKLKDKISKFTSINKTFKSVTSGISRGLTIASGINQFFDNMTPVIDGDNVIEGDNIGLAAGKAAATTAADIYIGSDPQTAIAEFANFVYFGGTDAGSSMSISDFNKGGINLFIDTLTGGQTVDRADAGKYGKLIKNISTLTKEAADAVYNTEEFKDVMGDWLTQRNEEGGLTSFEETYKEIDKFFGNNESANFINEGTRDTFSQVTKGFVKVAEGYAELGTFAGENIDAVIDSANELIDNAKDLAGDTVNNAADTVKGMWKDLKSWF